MVMVCSLFHFARPVVWNLWPRYFLSADTTMLWGLWALLLCPLRIRVERPWATSRTPMERRGIYSATGLRVNGSVTEPSVCCTNHASCSCLASNFKASCFPEHAFRVLFSNAANHAVPQEH